MRQSIVLAIKFFKRELQQGELNLLIISLILACGSLSSIGFLIHHIDSSMNQHANQLNGAQLVLKSSTAIPQHWQDKAQQLQLKQAQMLVFPSMLVVNDEFKLAQIKAVSDNFPLQGELRVKKQASSYVTKAPPRGELWLDNRLALFFKLPLNNKLLAQNHLHEANFIQTEAPLIELGEAQFKATALLERVPGQSNSLFSIAPTAMINLADVPQTSTIQPGSRVKFIYFFSAESSHNQSALTYYQQWLKPKLLAGQSLRSGVEDLKAVNASLKKAADYLSLAGILSVLLSAIAITISSHHYGQKQYKNNAIMLCLGASEKTIILIEVFKLLMLGISACIIGIVLGCMVYIALLSALGDVLSHTGVQFYFTPAVVSFSMGLFLLLMISMANLLRIKKLSPMALIRKELLSSNSISQLINTKLFYFLSLIGLVLISIGYSGNLNITLLFYLLIIVSTIFFYFIAQFLLFLLLYSGQRWQFINRLSLLNLQRHKQAVLLQTSSFSLIFSLLIIIFLLRTELLDNWKKQFPQGTPNHFVINVQSYEQEQFKHFLKHNNISTQGLYPMVRGRLSHINQHNINQAVSEEALQHNALNRELNLSVADIFNSIDNQAEQAQISIEKSLAKSLAIKKGDSLRFTIGSNKIEGIVTKIRKVKWDSFQPNFYIIFSPGIIEQYPITWIASFYLAAENKHKLNQLMVQFPGITIIEVDEILKEVQFIINKVSTAIEVIFIFIVLAGVLILSASLSSTLASRLYENAVIRTLGASTRQLRVCLLIEFAVIALLSALIAIFLAEFSAYILYHHIFQLDYSLHPEIWLTIICAALVLICGLGMLMVNKILTQTVHHSLTQQMD